MGELNHILRDLLPELVQFLVPLFDLFIKSLVLDLELLKIDKMETICKLFPLLEDLLLVC